MNGNYSKANTVRWEEMFPLDLLRTIEKFPVCYLVYGLAEPHGAYNAIGLDWLKAQALAERAAREIGGVVAPPFAWHIHERPFFDWLGDNGVPPERALCSSIPADLFLQMVLHQIRVVDARGFKVAILLTGHYGGLEEDMRLLCEYYTRRTGSPLRLRAFADGELIRYEDFHGDHAGICETSQLIALRPDMVDLSRKESESPVGPWIGTDFPLPDGSMPSCELGEKIVRSQIESLREIVHKELNAYKPIPGWVPPNQYEVADIWNRFALLTRKYWWCSLTLDEFKRGERCPFPGWEALGE